MAMFEGFQLLYTPERTMKALLTPDELELYEHGAPDGTWPVTWKAPAVSAFVFKHWWQFLVVVAFSLLLALALGLFGVQARTTAFGFVLLLLALEIIIIEIRIWLRTYTRYIIAPSRIIKMDGIIAKNHAYIEWDKITDMSMASGFLGQTFDFGDITIETANDISNFGVMRDVPAPRQFLDKIRSMRMVKAKSPLNEAALRALVSLDQVLTQGGLVIERTEPLPGATGGAWRVRREPAPPEG